MRTRQRRHRWPLRLGVLAGVGLSVALNLSVGWSALLAGLPPTPDPAKLPVSVEVVDRDGDLLRPFTTADGRWRLPASPEAVDPRFLADTAKLDRIAEVVAKHWPETIAPGDLASAALVAEVRQARAALLDALGLGELN